MNKVCTKCNMSKTFNDFDKSNSCGDGHHTICKNCRKTRAKKYYKNNREKVLKVSIKWQKSCKGKEYAKFKYLKYEYGLTKEEFLNLLESQESKCKICKNSETQKTKSGILKELSVDHCHSTGKVRGLLCARCNHLLGKAKDNIKILESAIEYLKHYN